MSFDHTIWLCLVKGRLQQGLSLQYLILMELQTSKCSELAHSEGGADFIRCLIFVVLEVFKTSAGPSTVPPAITPLKKVASQNAAFAAVHYFSSPPVVRPLLQAPAIVYCGSLASSLCATVSCDEKLTQNKLWWFSSALPQKNFLVLSCGCAVI